MLGSIQTLSALGSITNTTMDLGTISQAERKPLLIGETVIGNLVDNSAPVVNAMDRRVPVQVDSVPVAAKISSLLCCPMVFPGSCYTVNPSTEVAVLHLGKLTAMSSKPGLYFTYPCFRETRSILTNERSVSMPSTKVADQTGAPVIVSAILNYYVSDAKLALFNVKNVDTFVLNNAEAVLKQVVGRYSYYQLKSETSQINSTMLSVLQPIIESAGCTVTSMMLNELNYAPEVASGMLRTQQAAALLEARQIIVEGAVKIALDAVKMLEQEGMHMEPDAKARMVTNLLTVSVSEADTTPTVNVS